MGNDQDILLCENTLHSADEGTDWSDIEALAQSEVRAAKYSMECLEESEGWLYDDSSASNFFDKECIRDKAINSVSIVKNIAPCNAKFIVDKVFDKSYNEEL